jgi:hypothetical protein
MRDDIEEFSGDFDNIFTAALQSVIIASSEWQLFPSAFDTVAHSVEFSGNGWSDVSILARDLFICRLPSLKDHVPNY